MRRIKACRMSTDAKKPATNNMGNATNDANTNIVRTRMSRPVSSEPVAKAIPTGPARKMRLETTLMTVVIDDLEISCSRIRLMALTLCPLSQPQSPTSARRVFRAEVYDQAQELARNPDPLLDRFDVRLRSHSGLASGSKRSAAELMQ